MKTYRISNDDDLFLPRCAAAKGFASILTGDKDEHYWANPFRRVIVKSYEGEMTLTDCGTDAEFVAELADINRLNAAQGRPILIIYDRSDRHHSELAREFDRLGVHGDGFDGDDTKTSHVSIFGGGLPGLGKRA
jgi:hypothetical protein